MSANAGTARNPYRITGSTVRITLRSKCGCVAVVDRADWPKVRGLAWYCLHPKRRPRRTTYAQCVQPGHRDPTTMHRFLFGLTKGDPQAIDHRDGNGLNNRRSNLRIATRTQNAQNSAKTSRPSPSQFKGVVRAREGDWIFGDRRIHGECANGKTVPVKNLTTLKDRYQATIQALIAQHRTLQEMGDQLGISHERARQIIVLLGLRRRRVSRRRGSSWYAQITVNKRVLRLGSFATELEAALAYDRAARQHFGEFARCNFAEPPRTAAVNE